MQKNAVILCSIPKKRAFIPLKKTHKELLLIIFHTGPTHEKFIAKVLLSFT
jgi:hypothetical protein